LLHAGYPRFEKPKVINRPGLPLQQTAASKTTAVKRDDAPPRHALSFIRRTQAGAAAPSMFKRTKPYFREAVGFCGAVELTAVVGQVFSSSHACK
jgi:hypothetical protein